MKSPLLRSFKMPIPTSPTVPMEARLRERQRPDSPVVMYQRWEELLFLHWRVAPDQIAPTLPPGLRVDTFEGQAWIGVVPFFMRAVRPRGLPALPGLSDFQELNLRTYVVDAQGRPGVWFYSLDTPQRLANWIARKFFHLNYQRAQMSAQRGPNGCAGYQAIRAGDPPNARGASFAWQRRGEPFAAEPGSLEFFLIERYRLFAHNSARRRLYSGQVHHAPYQLQAVQLQAYSRRLFALNALAEPAGPPDSVLASAGLPVQIHPLQRT